MIKEIVKFTEQIYKDIPEISSWNIKPSEGLHIFLKMDIERDFCPYDTFYYTKKNETDEESLIREKTKKYESNGRRIGTTMNKAFHKKFFACNPFIISFKKKTFSELSLNDFEDFMETAKEVSKLTIYEGKIADTFVKECFRIKEREIKKFTITLEVEKKVKKQISLEKKEEKVFSLLKDNDYINFYLECFPNEQNEVIETDFKKYYEKYLNQKGFNQDIEEYKIGEINNENETEFVFFNELFEKQKDAKGKLITKKNKPIYTDEFIDKFKGFEQQNSLGISDYLNGLNGKKPYLEHKTAIFQKGISQYIDGNTAMALFKFEQLISVNRILPNPLPIMIWSDNFNNSKKEEIIEQDLFLKEYKEKIKPIKDKEIRIGFTEILRNIFEKNNAFKLSNFYLFNFAGGKLRDFDFIEEFQYDIIGDLKIKAIFNDDKKTFKNEDIKNIYDFERKIVMPIFDKGLVGEYKLEETIDKEKKEHKGLIFKYFDDLKDKDYKGSMFLLIIKYRKAFYDFIYKSKKDALNASIIQEILSVGLLDDIRLDEYRNGKHSNKYKIYKKLNIWFSLYDYFLTNNKNETMASKIDQFKDDFMEIIKGNRSLQDGEDELFAYTAGQVVHYIQSKTKSADKSYARLEPFLNKNGATEFKATLREEFAKYKHERYSNEFNNPFAQVNVYPLSRNMKDLLPFFLGGYFSKNLLFPGSI